VDVLDCPLFIDSSISIECTIDSEEEGAEVLLVLYGWYSIVF
jgi:hypothetical protein